MPLNAGSVLAPSRQLAPQQMLNATLTVLIWMMTAPRPRWGLYGLASVILLDFYPVVSLSQRIACLRFRMEVRSCIFVADVAADEVEQNALDYFELDGQAAAGGSRGRAGRQKRKLPTGLIPGSEAWGSWMAHRRWRQSRDDCDSQKSKVLSKLYTGLKDACDMIPIRKGDCAEPLRRPEGETRSMATLGSHAMRSRQRSWKVAVTLVAILRKANSASKRLAANEFRINMIASSCLCDPRAVL